MFTAIMLTALTFLTLGLIGACALMAYQVHGLKEAQAALEQRQYENMDSVADHYVQGTAFEHECQGLQNDIETLQAGMSDTIGQAEYAKDYKMFKTALDRLTQRVNTMDVDYRAFMRKHRWALDTIKRAESIEAGGPVGLPIVATKDQVVQAVHESIKARRMSAYQKNGAASAKNGVAQTKPAPAAVAV